MALLLGSVLLRGWLEGRAFSSEPLTPQASIEPASCAEVHLGQPDDAPAIAPENNQKIAPAARPTVIVERSPTPAFSQTLNILLVGVDQRPEQKYGGLPDTIVVAALSERDGHLGLISVPRDLYVEIPGHGMNRINATFSVAQSRNEDPLDLLERVVEDTLKLPIKHKLALNLGGFESVVDALGGVEVEVPCPIADNFLDSRTESGRRILKIEAGLQHLDGVTAGLYVRSRHGRSDFSRSRRQQAVLFGIKRKFSSLEGLTRAPEFLEQLAPLITSDMTRADVLGLARLAANIEPGKVHGLVLGEKEVEPHYTEDRKAVLLPNFGEIDRSLGQLFESELPGTQPPLATCPKSDVALTRRSPSKQMNSKATSENPTRHAD